MITDKLPPHNIDSEEAVIGSVLIDGELIRSLTLQPDDFYHEENGLFYHAMLELKEEGKGINQITVAEKLDRQGKLEECGGAAYLCHLVSMVPTSLDCQHYAEIVQRLSTSRKLIVVGESISKMGYGGDADTVTNLAKADKLLLDLRKTAGGGHIITPEDRTRLLMDRYSGLYSKEKGIGLSTGLVDLDWRIGGLFPGDLVILGARPKVGKTTLLQCISNHIGQSNNVLFCSAEMNVGSLSDRDVAGRLGVPANQIRTGGYDDEIMDSILNKALPWIDSLNIYHLDTTFHHRITTTNIYQSAYEIKERYGLSLVVVDYLGLLDDKYGNNQNDRIGYMTKNLKQIAMGLDIPVLCAHQLNRAADYRDDKRPTPTDLRDSGNVEQDADSILFFYREDYYYKKEDWDRKYPQGNDYYKTYPAGIAEILVSLQRHSIPGKGVKVLWDEKGQTYRDLAREEEYHKLL